MAKSKGIFGTVNIRDLAEAENRIIAAIKRELDNEDRALIRATIKRLKASAQRLQALAQRTTTKE